MHAYIVLSLLAGIRTEEARALRWQHVNLDGDPAARPPVPPHVAVWRSVRMHGDTQVVTGTGEQLATGDAVNLAARLEQAATPGEIVIGPQTWRLVRHAVEVEPLVPLQLKGKSQPVTAYRLVQVHADARPGAGRTSAPLVGRHSQLRISREAFARVVEERSCGLFTVLGMAGVGKSRLTAEFLHGIDARVVTGSCLSYGQGITYWPVVAMVKQLLDTEHGCPRAAGLMADDAQVAAAIKVLFGEQASVTSPPDIAWAVRKLFERSAELAPLVVVVDDLHWGEPVLFDLIEHIADFSRGAPIFVVCLARPELLDARPGWGGGKLNATNLLLEPLKPAETARLIDQLLPADTGIDAGLRQRVQAAAGGNPLFVEEMPALLGESPSGDLVVPPTVQALLAARLDQLAPGERAVLQCGSVEGESFHRGTVQVIAPEETDVPGQLMTLVRKDLVRPDRAVLPGEAAFRFRHLLIRDAAYQALSKADRAELHERFARWLEDRDADLVELHEIVGYHLEQAFRYRCELGPADQTAPNIATLMCGQDREEPGPQRRPDKADTDRQAAGSGLQKVTSALEWGDGAMAPALSMIVSDASTRVITVPFSVVKGWHAPAGRRPVKPRPLAQARQIGPAAPAGARIGPVRRASLKTTPTASGQMAGYTGSRPADVTLVRLPVDAEAR